MSTGKCNLYPDAVTPWGGSWLDLFIAEWKKKKDKETLTSAALSDQQGTERYSCCRFTYGWVTLHVNVVSIWCVLLCEWCSLWGLWEISLRSAVTCPPRHHVCHMMLSSILIWSLNQLETGRASKAWRTMFNVDGKKKVKSANTPTQATHNCSLAK